MKDVSIDRIKIMTGWLIVNEYLNSEKFRELQNLFMAAAKIKSVALEVHTNAEFAVGCDGTVELTDSVRAEGKRVNTDMSDDSTLFAGGTDTPDFIIFYDKDIELARALENAGYNVFNSANAIEICDSKYKTARIIEGYNRTEKAPDSFKIVTPLTYKVPFTYENIGINSEADFSFLDVIEGKTGYPMVIKESYSSFGMGVHLATDRDEAVDILCRHGSRECVIQEYIPGTAKEGSSDIRLQMVGDRCVAAMKRSNDHDFRANITNGGVMSMYEPSEADLRLAAEVMKALDLDFAGIDIMHKKCEDGVVMPVFCEANSNAHFKNLYDLTGINAAEYMLDYISSKVDK